METKVSRRINAHGDYEIGPNGAVIEDSSIATRARVRLLARRGEYWYDKDFGSRLHTIRDARDAEAQVTAMAKEALAPLLGTKEILSVECPPGGVYQDKSTGSLFVQLLLTVDEETIIKLEELPIGG